MKRSFTLSLALLFPTVASATDLDLRAEVAGSSTITVIPGQTVNYQVVGELSDNLSDGLAYFRFDLDFDGGPLSAANAPTSFPMTNFDKPAGITNPAGFIGTSVAGDLIQVGGAQNTINNAFAPYPNGSVTLGVADAGAPQVLLIGSLIAPSQVGTYTLAIGDVDANVILPGQTGFPFWNVEQTGIGTVTNLTIKVSALSSPVATVSISNPLPVTLNLHAGTPWGNRFYWLLGTAAGTSPGINLGNGLFLPLNPDAYTDFTIGAPNSATLSNNVNNLSPLGQSAATFNLPSGLNGHLVGAQISHAYVFPSLHFASDAVTITLVP